MTTALAVQLLPDDDEELGDAKMGFLDHLDELRRRLIHSVIAIAKRENPSDGQPTPRGRGEV